MIVWLTSYPKSGNTWVRSFLSSLIFTEYGEVDFDNMQKLSQYPMRSHFTDLLENLEDINSLSKNWISSQERINFDNKINNDLMNLSINLDFTNSLDLSMINYVKPENSKANLSLELKKIKEKLKKLLKNQKKEI